MVYDKALMIILNYAKKFGSLKELIYDQSYEDYEDENFSEKMLEEARTVIPKINVLKRGKLSICSKYCLNIWVWSNVKKFLIKIYFISLTENYFDIQYFESWRN